jgi:hypothetical protein
MEWAIDRCTSQYFETNLLYLVSYIVEDTQGWVKYVMGASA